MRGSWKLVVYLVVALALICCVSATCLNSCYDEDPMVGTCEYTARCCGNGNIEQEEEDNCNLCREDYSCSGSKDCK